MHQTQTGVNRGWWWW